MARAVDEAVFNDTAQLVNDFKHYFTAAGQRVSENRPTGNQAGGITTLEEKSLGAVQKAGDAPRRGAPLRRAIRRPGLGAARGPGQRRGLEYRSAAAGATVLLFTTGAARRWDFRHRR